MKYFNNNEPGSSLTHFIGWGLSVAGLVLLILAAAKYGSAWHVVSFTIFGSSMILLYLASTVYHIVPRSNKFKKLFQRIDLSLIFVLIAGTYTPIALIPLRGPWGWTLFGVAWGIAIIGIAIQVFKIKIKVWQQVLLYLIMGWLVVGILPVVYKTFSLTSFSLLLAGGLFYTIGVIFFSIGRKIPGYKWFGMHEIFHLFVMAGSFSHFWLMYKILVYVN